VPSGSCTDLSELPPAARAIVDTARRAVLATLDRSARPHGVPVCFALRGSDIVTAVDQKPKRGGELARIANVRARPFATIVMDRWDEDWGNLGWVMVRARVDVAAPGSADVELTARYEQYRDDPPRGDVLVLRPQRISWWTSR
jgi:PPOX class probable F420-dependent enzyme